MRKWQRIPALLLALLMMCMLCACGSAGKASGARTDAVQASGAQIYNGYATEETLADMAWDEDGGMGFSAAVSTVASSVGRTEGQEDEEPSESRDKIIYSADVTLETTHFDETVGRISGLMAEYDGWVESSSVSGSNYYQQSRGTASTRSASFTLRIPSRYFQTLMDSLSGLGNVPYSHIYTENVTSQYYDAAAHLKAYQTQETRLLEMMELAETVEDVIIIEDRLTELRYQIESIQSRLNNWDRRVSYSTISLSIQEVREYTPEEKLDPTFGEELQQALRDGLQNAGEFLKDLLLTILEVLPVLVILIPIIWFCLWLLGKLFRKLRSRRASGRGQKQPGRRKKKAADLAEEHASEADAAAHTGKENE